MAYNTSKEIEAHWTKYAKDKLVGRTIKSVRYMSDAEAEEWGWYKRPLIFNLDDGTELLLSSDDEGNDGGAMFGQKGKESLTFPVI